MVAIETGSSLRFPYQKSSFEIKHKVEKKVLALNEKIAEREARIAALRKKYDIDDSDLVQLLTAARRAQQKQESRMSFSYTKSNLARREPGPLSEEKVIGAGVVNNLLTENDFVESERDAVKNLQLIMRNLRPLTSYAQATGASFSTDSFSLSADELEYLGF